MKRLHDLIAGNEPSLIERVAGYARELGNGRYDSTDEEMWRASVSVLSAPLLSVLRDGAVSPDRSSRELLFASLNPFLDALDRGRHRERCVPLSVPLCLLKSFRQGCVDLLLEAGFAREDEQAFLRFLNRFFDRMEIAACAEWEGAVSGGGGAKVAPLRGADDGEGNRYLALFENLPCPAFLLDRDGRLDAMNRAAAEAVGWDAAPDPARCGERMRGRTIPHFAEDVASFLDAALPSRGYERAVDTPRGRRHYQVDMHRIRDASGNFDGAVLLLTDLTRRQELEDTLQIVLEEMEARVEERAADMVRSHNLLGAVISNTTDAAYVKDLEGRYLLINPAGARSVGRPAEEILGKDDTALFSRETAERIMESDRQVIRSGEVCNFEEEVTVGETRTICYTTKGPFRDPEGKIVGLFGTSRDITERKRAEEKQRRMREFLSGLLEYAPAAIYVKSYPEGRFQLVNREWEAITGMGRAQAVGLPSRGLFPDATAKTMEESDRRVAETGVPLVEEYEVEFAGTRKWIQAARFPLRDPEGGVVAVGGISVDITALKRTQTELESRRRELREIIDCVPAHIFIKDRENRFVLVNRPLEEAYGKGPGEVEGRSAFDLFPKETAQKFLEEDLEVMATGSPKLGIEEEVETVQGRRWLSTEKVPRRDARGEVIGVIGVAVDVTERKASQEQHEAAKELLRRSQRIESVGRLAAGVAHNLNNLLTVINGYSSLLEREFPPADPRFDRVKEIQRSGARAAELVGQLLAFGRRKMLRPKVVLLGELFREMEPGLRKLAEERAVLDLRYEGERGAVCVDPEAFRDAMEHLVTNACSRMPEGGEIRIRVREGDLGAADAPAAIVLVPGRYVVLTVTDTGPEMSGETLSLLFDPFQKSLDPGAGLELASIYGFIKQSRGYIWADRAPVRGTEFTILLPDASGQAWGEGGIPGI